MKIDTFESEHLAVPADLGPWRHDCRPSEWQIFAHAAHEAVDYWNGRAILPKGRDVAVTFRPDFFVRYVGMADDEQGCTFFGFLFTVPEKLEVLAWIELDEVHARVLWRGDQATFERAAFDMTMFEDAWLPELDPAA